ncbi:hypothetical protein [Actinomycetia phage DSL-LC01]|nr:hypothetical protein [Actinomycetia phage DSL-LC01]
MTPTVSYVCRVVPGEMPRLCKVLTAGDVSVETALNADNKEEFAELSDELILEHINNLVAFIKEKALTLEITPIANSPTQTWPLNGFKDIADAGMILDKWWWNAHNREESEEHDHDHEDDAV